MRLIAKTLGRRLTITMIRLYAGSGAQDVQVLDPVVPDQAWAVQKRNVVRLLQARGRQQAASILEHVAFELRHGTNGFNDDFCILYYRAALDRYVGIAEEYEDRAFKLAYREIAEAVSEAGHFIRFIVLDLDSTSEYVQEVAAVVTPSLAISSDAVQRALADAEQLIHSRGATSGVDRVHTAFHGYLIVVADKAGTRTHMTVP